MTANNHNNNPNPTGNPVDNTPYVDPSETARMIGETVIEYFKSLQNQAGKINSKNGNLVNPPSFKIIQEDEFITLVESIRSNTEDLLQTNTEISNKLEGGLKQEEENHRENINARKTDSEEEARRYSETLAERRKIYDEEKKEKGKNLSGDMFGGSRRKDLEEIQLKKEGMGYEKEKRTLGERIYENLSKSKGGGILGAIARAIKDSAVSGIRESSVGKTAQALNLTRGEWSRKQDLRIKESDEEENDISKRLEELRKQKERDEKEGYTEQEQEDFDGRTGDIYRSIDQNQSEQTDLFNSLATPASSDALNVRVINIEEFSGLGGMGKKKESGGGLLSGLASMLGFGRKGMAGGMLANIGGVGGILKGLGSIALLGGVGYGLYEGLTASKEDIDAVVEKYKDMSTAETFIRNLNPIEGMKNITVSLRGLIDTIGEQAEADAKLKEIDQKRRMFYRSTEQTIDGKSFEDRMSMNVDERKKMVDEMSVEQLTKERSRYGKMMADEAEKLEKMKKEKESWSGWIMGSAPTDEEIKRQEEKYKKLGEESQIFIDATNKKMKDIKIPENKEVKKEIENIKNIKKEYDKEIKFEKEKSGTEQKSTVDKIFSGGGAVVEELRSLRKMLEKAYRGQVENIKTEQEKMNTALQTAQSANGPLNASSLFYTSPPSGNTKEQMGVVNS